MKLTDIIALAKAGYKKEDVDELIKIELPQDPEEDPEKSTEPNTGSEGDPEPSPEDPQEPDFEVKYKELVTEFEKLKDDLKKAQEKNIKTPSDPLPDDSMKELEDIFRAYM